MTGIMQMFVGGGGAPAPVTYWSDGIDTTSTLIYPRNISLGDGVYVALGDPNNNRFGVAKFNKATGAFIWQKFFANSTNYCSATLDSSNNVYLVGSSGTSPSSSPSAVIKLDSSGTVIWSKTLSTGGIYSNYVVTDSSGNVYCVGGPDDGFSTRCRLNKLDSNGNFVWGREIYDMGLTGNSNARAVQLVIGGPNNYIYVFGYTSRSTLRAFIQVYDQSGSLIGARSFNVGGGYNGFTYGGGVDASGNIYCYVNIGAPYLIKLNSSFVKQWERTRNTPGTASGISVNATTGTIFLPLYPAQYGQAVDIIDTSGNFISSSDYAVVDGAVENWTLGLDQSAMYLGSYSNYLNPPTSTTRMYLLAKFQQTRIGGYYPTVNSTTGVYAAYNNVNWSSTSNVVVNSSTATANTISTTVTNYSPTTTTPSYATTSTAITIPATSGSNIYFIPGTYTWVAPAGVTAVSVVCVGGGAGGVNGEYGGAAGGGGGLGYLNNYSVTPGSSYTVVVGDRGYGGTVDVGTSGGTSSFVSIGTVRGSGGSNGGSGGGYIGTGGGTGGAGAGTNGGGGGAGGYSGAGGSGGTFNTYGNTATGGGGGGGGGAYSYFSGSGLPYSRSNGGNGGSVGIIGSGPAGAGGATATNGTAGSWAVFNAGGGGGGGGYNWYATGCCCNPFAVSYMFGNDGQAGIVRIVWPGNTRTFPSTSVTTP